MDDGFQNFLYLYEAEVIAAYDGDTLTLDIDLGLGIWARGQKVRLFGIDTPEVRGPERPEGLVARDYVRENWVGKKVAIRTHKDKTGKYGRWLVEVFLQDEEGTWLCLQDDLLAKGLAEKKTY